VGVVARSEVAGAHRLAQIAEADADRRAEQVLKKRALLLRRQGFSDKPGRRVRQRGPEAVHSLERPGIVYVHSYTGIGSIGRATRNERCQYKRCSPRKAVVSHILLLRSGLL